MIDDAASSPKCVILNDTSTRYHHGCIRVMEQLKSGLVDRGITIAACAPARHDWENDPKLIEHIRSCDLVVINGEGTLHHGNASGERLLKLATCDAVKGVPIALVNALYEQNPEHWGRYVEKFDIVSARDTQSAKEINDSIGRPVARTVADLSMSTGALSYDGLRDGLIVGDSVKWNRRTDLAKAASRLSADLYVPTKTLSSLIWKSTVAKRALYALYNGVLTLRQPKFVMPRDVDGYLRLLSSCEGHITGRFHAVCLSMVTGTPFLALSSNASKIERLLTDVGIGASRILTPDDLSSLTLLRAVRPFDSGEVQAVQAYLESARTNAATLMDDLAHLAFHHMENAA
ncbi:polysaccharide pyruvyl transferase family protein [Celeribacter marinus]|uniref:Polysaccharide pyruvyl transferase domain-containing protein n=1 Tax=Celeribacter marinus TaxID=1397108 RepID=A0A0P0AA29_9RHOB|nr:polysaccharide pyruvyl transferase family protein [Celeribacter marinus]ALI55572.1 hypothetical protein IMCC12053_1625 [Celeribacter marinus]SFK22791.1 Polysaccharide pyruvyl transferase [Celeribacter marinus]